MGWGQRQLPERRAGHGQVGLSPACRPSSRDSPPPSLACCHPLPPTTHASPSLQLPLCPPPTEARTVPTASESESFNLLPSALALLPLSTCTCLDCEDHNCTTEQSAFNSTGCTLKRSGIYIGWRHRPQRLTTSKPSAPTLGPRG